MAFPDFPESVKRTVAMRAGYRCSNPDCDKSTLGPSREPNKTTLIGEAAHIFGAQSGAARYRANMSDVERGELSNAIWLCRDCHGIVDKNPAPYPDAVLFAWREAHEQRVSEQLGKPGELLRLRALTAITDEHPDLPAYVRQLLKDRSDFWEYRVTAELLDHYLRPVQRQSRDLSLGLYTLPIKRLEALEFTKWAITKVAELGGITGSIAKIVTGEIQRSWGEPGQPGDPSEILHVCRLFARAGQRLVDVAEEVTFTSGPEKSERLSELIAAGAHHPIGQLATLPAFLRKTFGVDEQPSGVVEFSLVISLPDNWSDDFAVSMKEFADAHS